MIKIFCVCLSVVLVGCGGGEVTHSGNSTSTTPRTVVAQPGTNTPSTTSNPQPPEQQQPTQQDSPGILLTPTFGSDGKFSIGTVQGEAVWQTSAIDSFLYFAIPDSLQATAQQPLYVAVRYFDVGYQKLQIQYDRVDAAFATSELSAHSSLVNTNSFETAYFVLTNPSLLKRENTGADFRISSTGGPISIASVMVKKTPFSDPNFQKVLQKPWLSVIAGSADATTLKNKVMAGYQGWFSCPNDLNDSGWIHWTRNNRFTTSNFNTDMWPDMTQYPASAYCRADDVFTAGGKPAYVFSSTNPDVVQKHFSMMQENNIDGIFLQRFLDSNTLPGVRPEWVLANVRKSAGATGRIWAIEYDITGLTDANVVETVTRDWKWLNDAAKIRMDGNYAREKGKPVVFVWGLSLRTEIGLAAANALIDFLKNDPVYGGNYVIGGIGNQWPTQLATWQAHFQRYDGLLVWQPQNNNNDKTMFNSWGIDWYPHVAPGGSWANLSGRPQDFTDRLQGRTYWTSMYDVISVGADRMFVGMFDEYDEGTAIIPMSDDPPLPPPNGRFIDNQGMRSTWWLELTGKARAMLRKETPLTSTMPSP